MSDGELTGASRCNGSHPRLRRAADEMAAVRAFAKKKGPRPCFDLTELRACITEGRLPPTAEGAAMGISNSVDKGVAGNSNTVVEAAAEEGEQRDAAGAVNAAGAADASGALEATASIGAGAAGETGAERGHNLVKAAGETEAERGHSHYGCGSLLKQLLLRPDVLRPPPAEQPVLHSPPAEQPVPHSPSA